MNPLVLRPDHADLETDRITRALGLRGAEVIRLRDSLMRDTLRLRRSIRSAPLVHAFGLPALAAAIAWRSSVIFTPRRFPTLRQIAWLRAALAYRTIDIIASSQTMHRALVTRGLSDERCHLVRPGIRMADVPTTRDASLRQRLGFTDADTVLYVPLEITHDSGHILVAWAVSILNVMRPRYRLLFHGAGPARRHIEHLRQRLIDPRVLTVAIDIDPSLNVETVFSAADAVLMTPTAPVSPLTVALAMASNRPIIATTTRQLCEQLEDRHTCLLVKQASPRLIAQRITDLFDEPALAPRLQDRARAEAYDHFTLSRMLRQLDELYASGACHARATPSFSKPSEA